MSKSPSLRRIQADIRELALDPSDQYFAAPLENDMFEWHFTIRGAEGTDFEGGVYHGRILLPPEYPYKPPHIIFLTPTGRFETNKKICLSFSAFHPELWQPAWGIRLILEALISFLPTPGDGAIGALDYKPEERRRLAKLSQSFVCPHCGPTAQLLPKIDPEKKKSSKKSRGTFSKEIAELQRLQREREGGKKEQNNDNASKTVSEEDTKETTTGAAAKPPDAGEAKPVADTNTAKDNGSTPTTEVTTKTNSPVVDTIDQTPAVTADEITREESSVPDGVSKYASAEDNSSSVAATATFAAFEQDTSLTLPQNPDAGVDAATAEDVVDDDDDAANDNMAEFYDSLLNISTLLMFCICVLLWKKGMDLFKELKELREAPVVDTIMNEASSVAASAAASDEL